MESGEVVEEVEKKENISIDEEDIIKKANSAAERLEKATQEHKKILEKHEKVIAEAKLQGRSFAGRMEEKKKEETPEEIADKFKKGEIGNPLRRR